MAKPTQGQLDKCEQLGIEVPEDATKTKVTELIKAKEAELAETAGSEEQNQEESTQEQQDTGSETDGVNESKDESKPDASDDQTDTEQVEVNSWSDVKKVLSLKTSVDNKLSMLSKCGFKPVELFVAFYIDYGTKMSTDKTGMRVTEQEGGKFNTRLFNNLLNVVRDQDDEVFKVKMDIINFVFKNGAKDAFNEFKLCRFSDHQKLSEKQLATYHRLCVLVSSLADASTRDKNKKSLAGFGNNGSVLTDEDVARLKRYYNL